MQSRLTTNIVDACSLEFEESGKSDSEESLVDLPDADARAEGTVQI